MGAGQLLLLAQNNGDAAAAAGIMAIFGGAFLLVWLAIYVVIVAGFWKMFEKAGKPGWAAIVPIYNLIILCEIAGKPGWWAVSVLCFPVWFIVSLFLWLEVAKKFGQSQVFAIGLWLLCPIFVLILGFGDAKYQGAGTPAA